MRRLPPLVVLLLLALATRSAHAEEQAPEASSAPAPRAMTLDEAIAFARAHHPRIASARARLEAAKRDAAVPGAEWLPRVGAMAQIVGSTVNNSTTTLLGTNAVDVPRIGATRIGNDPDFTPYASTAVALGLRQEVFDFGRIATERAAAELASDVERYRAAGGDLDVTYGAAQAYYAVLAAAAIEDASSAALARATQHRDLAKANVTSGMRPPIELTRAEADVARYEAALSRARGSMHIARTHFATAIGAEDAEIDAVGALTTPSALEPLAAVVQRAEHAPVVLEGRARVEQQRAETTRLGAQTRPNVFATAAVSARAGGAPATNGPSQPGDGFIPTVPNYDVGVVLSWPLLEPSWGRRAEASRAREAALASEARAVLLQQRAAIATAWREADVAAETLASLTRGATAATANYDQADHRFRVGLGTSTELADAQAVRTQADVELAIGRFQLARARVALERAMAEVR